MQLFNINRSRKNFIPVSVFESVVFAIISCIFPPSGHRHCRVALISLLCGCRRWRTVTWTMSGSGTSGFPAWVCPNIAHTSWSPWWTPGCLTTSQRRTSEASWRWWTASTGKARSANGEGLSELLRTEVMERCRCGVTGTVFSVEWCVWGGSTMTGRSWRRNGRRLKWTSKVTNSGDFRCSSNARGAPRKLF